MVLADVALHLFIASMFIYRNALNKEVAKLQSGEGTNNKTPEELLRRQRAAQIAQITAVVVLRTIMVLKFIVKIIRTVFVAIAAAVTASTVALITVIVLIVGVTGYLFIDDPFGFTDSETYAGVQQVTVNNGASTGGEAPVPGTVSKPDGITAESWAKGDAIGQGAAYNAYYMLMHPVDKNGLAKTGSMTYKQEPGGPYERGRFDCIQFVTAAVETLGYHMDGSTRSPVYDYTKDDKGDVKFWGVTRNVYSKVKGTDVVIGDAGDADILDKIQPGDMILTTSHVVMYIGKNEAGAHVIAHAGSPSSKGWTTAAAVGTSAPQDGTQVIFAKVDYILKSGNLVLRTSKVLNVS